MIKSKTYDKKEKQVENTEKCKLQRKKNFTKSMQSLNRLLKEQNLGSQ